MNNYNNYFDDNYLQIFSEKTLWYLRNLRDQKLEELRQIIWTLETAERVVPYNHRRPLLPQQIECPDFYLNLERHWIQSYKQTGHSNPGHNQNRDRPQGIRKRKRKSKGRKNIVSNRNVNINTIGYNRNKLVTNIVQPTNTCNTVSNEINVTIDKNNNKSVRNQAIKSFSVNANVPTVSRKDIKDVTNLVTNIVQQTNTSNSVSNKRNVKSDINNNSSVRNQAIKTLSVNANVPTVSRKDINLSILKIKQEILTPGKIKKEPVDTHRGNELLNISIIKTEPNDNWLD